MKRTWSTSRFLAGSAMVGLAWGCSVSGEQLFGGQLGQPTSTSGGGAGASGGSSSSGSTASSGGVGGDGAGGAGASGSGGSNSGGSSSGSSSGSGSTSSSSSGSSSASSGAGGSPVVPPLACGTQSCPPGGQNACCWDQYERHDWPRAECVDGPPSADNCFTQAPLGLETRIECQTDAHCTNGQVCCAKRVFTKVGNKDIAYYETLACANSCPFPDIELCDPGASPPYPCPLLPDDGGGTIQAVCKPSQLLPQGYFICGYP